MIADYTDEFFNAIDAAYTLYPEIKNSIEGISVIWELEHGLGKLSVKERDYVFMFNPGAMSLQTIFHEVAHMVCVALDKPVDHGIEFKKIMAKIWRYCSNIEIYKQVKYDKIMEEHFV